MAKIAPAHLDLKFQINTTDGNHSAVGDIDLARALSAVNRRLYRQGMLYYVEGITILNDPSQAPIGTVNVQTAMDSWMVHNAWKKGYKMWRAQRKLVTSPPDGGPGDHGRHYHGANMSGIEGKWADFKIELDDNSTTVLETSAADAGTIVPDEWALSEVFWDDDGTERSPTFCLLGATSPTTKIGLVQEYHISRPQLQGPDPIVETDASDSIYAKILPMQDELSDELINDIEEDNDHPPYDKNEMAGGDTVADCPMQTRFGGVSYFSPSGSVHGFKVPCGLMRIQIGLFQADSSALTSGTAGLAFIVHLAAGPYKGVMAEPMGQ